MGKIDPKFRTTVTVTGGRDGHAVSDDGALDVQLRRPTTNDGTDGTTPEQLFAAAWGGCYQSALIAEARDRGEDASGSTVRVEIALGPDEEGGYGLAAKVAVEIPGLDKARVQEIADAAHKRCPYSKATRGNIEVEIAVA
jgi:Ohr subfamily peroxiredoxin